MKERKVITSLRNGRICDVVELIEKSRVRRARRLFVVEGHKEIKMALSAGYLMDTLFVYDGLGSVSLFLDSLNTFKRIYKVNGDVFAKMAYRENSDGLLAVMHARTLSLEKIKLSDNPFYKEGKIYKFTDLYV